MLTCREQVPVGWYLEFYNPNEGVKFLPLVGDSVKLNRSICPTHFVSREHAVLDRNTTSNEWTIRDLGSMNGTIVNNVNLVAETCHNLALGDIITLGVSSIDLSLIPYFEVKFKSPLDKPVPTQRIKSEAPQVVGHLPDKGLEEVDLSKPGPSGAFANVAFPSVKHEKDDSVVTKNQLNAEEQRQRSVSVEDEVIASRQQKPFVSLPDSNNEHRRTCSGDHASVLERKPVGKPPGNKFLSNHVWNDNSRNEQSEQYLKKSSTKEQLVRNETTLNPAEKPGCLSNRVRCRSSSADSASSGKLKAPGTLKHSQIAESHSKKSASSAHTKHRKHGKRRKTKLSHPNHLLKRCSVPLMRCDSPRFKIEAGLYVPWKRKRLKKPSSVFEKYKMYRERKLSKQSGAPHPIVHYGRSRLRSSDESEGDDELSRDAWNEWSSPSNSLFSSEAENATSFSSDDGESVVLNNRKVTVTGCRKDQLKCAPKSVKDGNYKATLLHRERNKKRRAHLTSMIHETSTSDSENEPIERHNLIKKSEEQFLKSKLCVTSDQMDISSDDSDSLPECSLSLRRTKQVELRRKNGISTSSDSDNHNDNNVSYSACPTGKKIKTSNIVSKPKVTGKRDHSDNSDDSRLLLGSGDRVPLSSLKPFSKPAAEKQDPSRDKAKHKSVALETNKVHGKVVTPVEQLLWNKNNLTNFNVQQDKSTLNSKQKPGPRCSKSPQKCTSYVKTKPGPKSSKLLQKNTATSKSSPGPKCSKKSKPCISSTKSSVPNKNSGPTFKTLENSKKDSDSSSEFEDVLPSSQPQVIRKQVDMSKKISSWLSNIATENVGLDNAVPSTEGRTNRTPYGFAKPAAFETKAQAEREKDSSTRESGANSNHRDTPERQKRTDQRTSSCDSDRESGANSNHGDTLERQKRTDRRTSSCDSELQGDTLRTSALPVLSEMKVPVKIEPFIRPIKQEPVDRELKLEPKDDAEFSYSQHDPVICISSDEEEESGKLKDIPLMPLVTKKEPELIDLVELEEEILNDDDIDNEPTDDIHFENDNYFPDLSQSLLDEIEYEERRDEFRQAEEQRVSEQMQSRDVDLSGQSATFDTSKFYPRPQIAPSNEFLAKPSTSFGTSNFYSKPPIQFSEDNQLANEYAADDDYFPVLSQSFLDEIAEEERIANLSKKIAENQPRTAGFTEAQPLHGRPVKRVSLAESFSDVLQKLDEVAKKKKKNCASSKGKKQSKLAKFKHDMIEKRVRIPGGGSDGRKSLAEFHIPKKKTLPDKSSDPPRFKEPTGPVPKAKTLQKVPASSDEGAKKKTVWGKQGTSRMTSIIEELQKAPGQISKSKALAKKAPCLGPQIPVPSTNRSHDNKHTNLSEKPISKVLPNTSRISPTEPCTAQNKKRVHFDMNQNRTHDIPKLVRNNSFDSSEANHTSRSSLQTTGHHHLPNNRNSLLPTTACNNILASYSQIAIQQIVSWNQSWLNEQEVQKKAPPVCTGYSLMKVRHSYTSSEEYFKTYYPLLVLEMWASVFTSYRESLTEPRFGAKIESKHSAHGNLIALQCAARVQTDVPHYNQSNMFLGQGTILEVHFSLTDPSSKKATRIICFGYVFLVRQEPTADPRYKYQKFSMYVKNRSHNIDFSHDLVLRKVSNVRTFIRQVESLGYLSRSEMSASILNPSTGIPPLVADPRVKLKVYTTFNEKQMKIILHSSTAVYQSPGTPQIVLIQGPPGTGKTRLITGIIQQLLYGKPDGVILRMLVVAPSNAAIDEITSRLIALRSYCKTRGIQAPKFVRIGQTRMMHPDVKPYSLDSLVNQYIQDYEGKVADLVSHIENKKDEIYQSSVELVKLRALPNSQPFDVQKKDGEVCYLKQKLNELECRLQSLKRSQQHTGKYRYQLIEKADIILSTLNSCYQSNLNSLQFTCCIVDEATQCSEPEVLSPIMTFGIQKLILVGDPQQLPATVKSVEANDCNYSMSMFERMFRSVESDTNKILFLTDQYRMHQEICSFPSREFYNNCLITKVRKEFFPLKPYLLFDLKDSRENMDPKSSSISNDPEAMFVAHLCLEIFIVTKGKHSIGIITPYRDQVKQIESKLQVNGKIEVNTVDGFQGREKDIIIISCVRSNHTGNIGFMNNRQRLNVAITRASKCLVICGNLHLLSVKDHVWQKLIADAVSRKLVHTTSTQAPVNQLVKDFLIVNKT